MTMDLDGARRSLWILSCQPLKEQRWPLPSFTCLKNGKEKLHLKRESDNRWRDTHSFDIHLRRVICCFLFTGEGFSFSPFLMPKRRLDRLLKDNLGCYCCIFGAGSGFLAVATYRMTKYTCKNYSSMWIWATSKLLRVSTLDGKGFCVWSTVWWNIWVGRGLHRLS